MRFDSQVTELLLRNRALVILNSFTLNSSMHLVGKTMHWIEKWLAAFLVVSTSSSITVQSLGEIKLHAPAVGANMWCLSVLFCLSHSESGRQFLGWDIFWTAILSPFMGRFWFRIQPFFRSDFPFRTAKQFLINVAWWNDNFHEIAVKNCKKSKNRRKSLCTSLHTTIVKVRTGSPKTVRNEQVSAPQKSYRK